MGVHPSSIVDRHAEIADDAEIGPFCHVHAGVRIGAGTRLVSHVVVTGNTTLGAGNVVHPFVVLGGEAQVRKGAEGTRRGLEIGDHNVFRESVTVNTSSGDVGGVVLDIGDRESLWVAYEEMAERLGPDVSIDAMAPPGVEISLGVVRDENFGPLIVVAAGGTQVELLADRAVACPPITRDGAAALLRSLRTAPLLSGWRGAQPVNVDALIDAILGFSQLAVELGEHLDAVEANPVIVSPAGLVAVDALVIRRSS